MLISVYDEDGVFVAEMTCEEYNDYCDENDTVEDEDGLIIDPSDAEVDDGFTPNGQYYDTEYGDNPPNHIYESGMYLGDGVWVSQDFFG